jgi:hypothetical protein
MEEITYFVLKPVLVGFLSPLHLKEPGSYDTSQIPLDD